ncbi:MAG: hypothetical protein HRU30_05710 [Rhodobacteraceae bacterium]|nr:hypothetical protein [Paracoccaceae bacterium]
MSVTEHPTDAEFLRRGYACFPAEPQVLDWVAEAQPAAEASLSDPAFDALYACGRTWFVGLDALPNDAVGRVGASAAFGGQAADMARRFLGDWPDLHRAQVSATFPGYPQPREGESDAAFGYRLRRDAAHVDGVLGEGTPKRRYVREPHGFVLGIALNPADPDATPLVAWEGSHKIMQDAFRAAFAGVSAAERDDLDVTDIYVSVRKHCFENCTRVELPLALGETVLLHPFTLHGVAPWRAGEGHRSVAYFRPEVAGGVPAWLGLPG